jgi:hypothetical protein
MRTHHTQVELGKEAAISRENTYKGVIGWVEKNQPNKNQKVASSSWSRPNIEFTAKWQVVCRRVSGEIDAGPEVVVLSERADSSFVEIDDQRAQGR